MVTGQYQGVSVEVVDGIPTGGLLWEGAREKRCSTTLFKRLNVVVAYGDWRVSTLGWSYPGRVSLKVSVTDSRSTTAVTLTKCHTPGGYTSSVSES